MLVVLITKKGEDNIYYTYVNSLTNDYYNQQQQKNVSNALNKQKS